jgi:beta-galactosidase
VRVNGKEVGRHIGGFTAFVFDITDALQKSDNRLEIEVDNRFDRNIPPYSADFTVYGGLYRDVWLVETDPVYFDSVPDGGPGIVIEADPATGGVTVIPRVVGATAPVYTLEIEGPGLSGPIAAKGLSAVVPSPGLWTPETPNVYRATVTVRDGDHSDTVSLPFGFRKVGFDGNGLFRLNGKVRKIRGVNYHQDREGIGWATAAADRAADIRMIKELGADGVRTAHYPHAPDVYDECDRLGLLAWIEMPNVNIITVSDAYRANAMRLAEEVVAQYRHHPSIFVWSTSNEIKLVRSKEENAGMTELERDLDAYVRRTDPSRPTALATFKPMQTEFNAIPAAIGFNFYPGWYRADADEMDSQIDDALAKNPYLKALAVSEYGAGATPGEFESPDIRNAAGAPFHSEGYAANVHHLNYRSIAAHPRVWGSFVWLMFDFASDTRREGGRFGLNDKGLVGFDHQTKKDPYWLYKANWSADPVLHLVGEGSRITTNSSVRIMAFSNVGDVSLTVNGKDCGIRATDAVKTAVWEKVPLNPGDNAIEIKSGNRTAKAVWRYARPVTVHVAPDGSDITGDGSAQKPFATAVCARDALRALKKAGRLDAGGTVVFADGVYVLTNALELTAADSGSKRFPIVWKAANRAKAVFTG